MTQPLVAEHRGGSNRVRNDRSRNRRTHDTVPFIASCSHFTRKNTRFRAPASSPTQPPCNIHAAITMRFAASRSKPASLCTCMATPDDNNHAVIPMRSATTDSRNAKNYAHRHNHSLQNTEEEPIASGTTAATTAAHIGTFHRQLQPLYTEKHKVSCSGFLPNTTPMQHSRSHYNAFRSIP